MNSSDVSSGLGSVLSCLVVIGVIALVVFAISRSKKSEVSSKVEYSHILQGLSSDKQTLFVMQYNNVKKDPTIALLLCLFFGGVGAHKFYLGQPGTGVLYLLFCWTFIPVIISFFELFTITGYVNQYNLDKATETATMLGG